MLKEFSQSFERYSLPEKSEYLEISILVEQDFDSIEYSKLSEAHFLQLINLAQNQLKHFLESRFIYEAVPENSKIIAVSSNLPLIITLSFLLEDKKKSLLVYDELEDSFIGSFTCFDALLIFYILYILVKNENCREIDDNFPFKSLEELSTCSTKFWLKEVLDTDDTLSRKLITMTANLYEGLKLCLDLESNYKRIRLKGQEFNFNDLGTWIIEDRNKLSEFESVQEDLRSKSMGLYPICYFSPLTILSDLVQNLQICSGISKELQPESETITITERDDSECEISPQGSIFKKIFHNKVLKHLGIGRKTPKCLKTSSSFKLVLEMFLKEGLTHIPIVTEEDEIFTGIVLTMEKCCMYLARCVSNQEKAQMEDNIENIFNIYDQEMYHTLESAVVQLSGSNCEKNCFEYINENMSKIETKKIGKEREFKEESQVKENIKHENFNSTFLVDICLSGAISHILLSEDQCLVLVDKKTKQVTALIEFNMSNENKNDSVLYEEVLPDAFYEDPDLMKIYSLKIPVKLANEFSGFINDDQFTRRFPHIKRMRKVVIKEKDSELNNSSISLYETKVEILIGETKECLPIEANNYLRENGIDKVWDVIEVPKNPPLTRERFSQLSKIWPLSFLKPRFNPEILSDQTQRESDRLVKLACKVGEFAHTNGNPPRGCIITLKGKIVAIGEDSRNSDYPWMHSVMKAVDNFSRRANASSPTLQKVTNSVESGQEGRYKEKYVQEIEDDQDQLILMMSKYKISEDEILPNSELKDQYLCTNGIVYLSHEPCISCSMALVHSRVSKVFYMYKDKERGFLGSNHKLHCVSELNHHYRVFKARIN
ncbi:uncharacterized protein cubi_02820 [Cryptosporidium ubiquitum]|uniref:CMP/dCMP-type deaminase domain-containing protein n=1 Tax=Cryptosporidium ubiquitum TaxID=857276 RepID=A0A1J4MID8_9CRYT|nr:uncharacterized protein cubi_02820 [Cryptosporidium ubiquitum]OII74018.1 hypothetical protein cubi_02820 [Cryptosporidium ubiquitum]